MPTSCEPPGKLTFTLNVPESLEPGANLGALGFCPNASKIAAKTGLEFAIDIAPVGQEPKLVGKAVKDMPAHIYAGASLLFAGT